EDQSGKLLRRAPGLSSAPPQSLLVLLTHALRIGQQRTDVVPHRTIQQIGAALFVSADALAAKPIGIAAHAAIVAVVASPTLACRAAQSFTVIGITALLTN